MLAYWEIERKEEVKLIRYLCGGKELPKVVRALCRVGNLCTRCSAYIMQNDQYGHPGHGSRAHSSGG